jgi:hypothetical protein
MLGVTTSWRVLGLRMEGWSSAMEGSSEKAVADKQEGMVLQLGS